MSTNQINSVGEVGFEIKADVTPVIEAFNKLPARLKRVNKTSWREAGEAVGKSYATGINSALGSYNLAKRMENRKAGWRQAGVSNGTTYTKGFHAAFRQNLPSLKMFDELSDSLENSLRGVKKLQEQLGHLPRSADYNTVAQGIGKIARGAETAEQASNDLARALDMAAKANPNASQSERLATAKEILKEEKKIEAQRAKTNAKDILSGKTRLKAITEMSAEEWKAATKAVRNDRINAAVRAAAEQVRQRRIEERAAAERSEDNETTNEEIANDRKVQSRLREGYERTIAAQRSLTNGYQRWKGDRSASLGDSHGRIYGQRFARAAHNGMMSIRFGVGALGAYWASQAVTSSIDAAVLEQEALSFAENIFGPESIKSIEAWSRASAAALGMSSGEAIDAANNFGTFAKNMGLSGEAAVEFVKTRTKLAADMAEAKGTSTQEAVTALTASMRNEQEPVRRFGILINEYSITRKAYEMGIIDKSKDIEKATHLLDKAEGKLKSISQGTTDARINNLNQDITKAMQSRGAAAIALAQRERELLAVEKESGKNSFDYQEALKKFKTSSSSYMSSDKTYVKSVDALAEAMGKGGKETQEYKDALFDVKHAQDMLAKANRGNIESVLSPDQETAVVAALHDDLSEMIGITGMFEKSQDNYATSLRILQRNMTNFAASVGKGIIPPLTTLYKFINDELFADLDLNSVTNTVSTSLGKLSKSIQRDMIDKYGTGENAIKSIFNNIMSGITGVVTFLTGVQRFSSDLAGLFSKSFATIAHHSERINKSLNGEGFSSTYEAFMNAIEGMFVIFTTAAVRMMEFYARNEEGIQSWIDKFKQFGTFLANNFDTILKFLTSMLALKTAIAAVDVAKDLKSLAGVGLGALAVGVGRRGNVGEDAASAAGITPVVSATRAAGDEADRTRGKFGQMWAAISASKVGQAVSKMGAAFARLRIPPAALTNPWTALAAVLASVVGMLTMFDDTFKRIGDDKGGAAGTTLSAFGHSLTFLKDAMSDLWTQLKSLGQTLYEALQLDKLFGEDAGKGTLDMFITILSGAGIVIASVLGGIVKVLQGAVWLIEKLVQAIMFPFQMIGKAWENAKNLFSGGSDSSTVSETQALNTLDGTGTLSYLVGFFDRLSEWGSAWDNFKTGFSSVTSSVGDAAGRVTSSLSSVSSAIWGAGMDYAGDVWSVMISGWSRVTSFFSGTVNFYRKLWSNVFGGAQYVFERIMDAVVSRFNFVIAVFQKARQWFAGLWADIFGGVISIAVNVFQSLISWRDNFVNMFIGVLEWFRGLPEWFLNIGKEIGAGLKKGLESMFQIDTLKDWSDEAAKNFKSFWGIKSPSRVMMGMGQDIMRGLSVGIEMEAPQAKKTFQSASNFADISGAIERGMAVASPSYVPVSQSSGGGVQNSITVNVSERDNLVDSLVRTLAISNRALGY